MLPAARLLLLLSPLQLCDACTPSKSPLFPQHLPLSDQDMSYCVGRMQTQSTSSDKKNAFTSGCLPLAKSGHGFSAPQMVQILQQLPQESDRVAVLASMSSKGLGMTCAKAVPILQQFQTAVPKRNSLELSLVPWLEDVEKESSQVSVERVVNFFRRDSLYSLTDHFSFFSFYFRLSSSLLFPFTSLPFFLSLSFLLSLFYFFCKRNF